jgi:hypothetical protein
MLSSHASLSNKKRMINSIDVFAYTIPSAVLCTAMISILIRVYDKRDDLMFANINV